MGNALYTMMTMPSEEEVLRRVDTVLNIESSIVDMDAKENDAVVPDSVTRAQEGSVSVQDTGSAAGYGLYAESKIYKDQIIATYGGVTMHVQPGGRLVSACCRAQGACHVCQVLSEVELLASLFPATWELVATRMRQVPCLWLQYVVQIDATRYIDGRSTSAQSLECVAASFANSALMPDSCELQAVPNASLMLIGGRVELVCTRTIYPGEQVLATYEYDVLRMGKYRRIGAEEPPAHVHPLVC